MILNIKNKIILSHSLLIILLLAGVGYQQYQHQLATHIKRMIYYHESASASLISDISEAISGANYANIQMPSLLREIERNNKISSFIIEGTSDKSNLTVIVFYEQSIHKMWRGNYPKNYQLSINRRIESLQETLGKKDKTKQVKINFLLARNKDKLIEYDKSQQLTLKYQQKFQVFNKHDSPYIDMNSKKLYISLPTTNKNGGTMHIVFHADEITEIQRTFLENILLELVVAFIFSLIILTLLASHIIKPLNRLSQYISESHESDKITNSEMPGIERTDEIGVLANTLFSLLKQKKEYEEQLKKLTQKDPLTGLRNRRALENIFLSLTPTEDTLTAILYIDIDNFKKYNDFYGHNMGDVALRIISKAIKDSLNRKNDYAFRLGGEEFAVLFSVVKVDQIQKLAEKIRKNIENLKIEHKFNGSHSMITISVGVCKMHISPDDLSKETLIKMLTHADKNLYMAKAAGRNKTYLS